MMNAEVQCPLCTHMGFQSVDALRIALVSAASRNITCPICDASLTGLDKLTVHLFGHTLPQHELHIVNPAFRINCDAPQPVPQKMSLTSQESTKNIEVQPTCVENFQNEISNKASESTSIPNQDLSSLLCWLPLTYFPDKSPTLPTGSIVPALQDQVNNRIALQSQQSDGRAEGQLLGAAENNTPNNNASFILVSLPSLLDVKKEIPNCSNRGTNKLSLSDVSSLSGKLLMLDCSGNSQSNNNIGANNSPDLSNVQITMPDQNVLSTASINVFPQSQNTSPSDRKVNNSSSSCNTEGDDKQSKEIAEDGTPKSEDKALRCSLCFLQFTDSNILSLHQQLIHEGTDSLQSRLTAFEKESSSNQDADPTEIKQEENYQCHLCSKTFQMQGSLMVHLRVAHATPTMVGLASRIKGSLSDSPVASTVSTPGTAPGKSAKDQSQGKNDNKQWECTDCGKFFTTKYFLKKHKRLHTGEMPYSCPTCGKSFTFQQSYHKHLLYHSDEKPHTCTECGRSFKELSTLHNHQRIHTGEKPWACETCGKCFRQRVSYLVHRRIHTGVMPYCCTLCNKSFRYKVSQRTHKCVAQTAGASNRQSGDLLQRLLFDQLEETCAEHQQKGEEGKLKNQDQAQFVQQSQCQPKGVESQSEEPANENRERSQLLYSSVNNDKSIFAQRSETSTTDFDLHSFQLQQSLSNIQNETVSQNNAILQNLSSIFKDQLKQTVVNEGMSSSCSHNLSFPGQNSAVNASSLLVVTNDKDIISAGMPGANIPISLLQVLQKEKCATEFSAVHSGGANNSLPTAPCPDAVKASNAVMSTPFVPDFLSMAMSAPTQTPVSVTGVESLNVPINSDPFHWDVSLDMPSHDHNDSITDSVSTSQETIDSLQSLLFGCPSTQL